MVRNKSCATKSPGSDQGWYLNINTIVDEPHCIAAQRKNKRKKHNNVLNNTFISIKGSSNETIQYILGQFCLGTTNNVPPDKWLKCRVKIDNGLILHFDDNITMVIQCTEDLKLIENVFKCKALLFQFERNGTTDTIDLKVFLNKLPLTHFTNKTGTLFKTLFHQFFNAPRVEFDSQLCNVSRGAKEIETLFKNVCECRKRTDGEQAVQHDQLIPKLRPYQEDAVRWMLEREKESPANETLHPLYQAVTLKSGVEIYYSVYTGYVTDVKPVSAQLRTGGILADEMGLGKTIEVLTCILNNPCSALVVEAESDPEDDVPIIEIVRRKRRHVPSERTEEVSEKKVATVEEKSPKKKISQDRKLAKEWYEKMLREVAIRPKKIIESPAVQCVCGNVDEKGAVACKKCGVKQHSVCVGYNTALGDYYCPKCWINQPLVPSGATLIVSPNTLRAQWAEEIKRHIRGNFRVLKYEGYGSSPIYPTKLQQYDVVLTTYSVLQSDLKLLEGTEGSQTSLRRPSRYAPPGSPISQVLWWRLCLDEAQTVDAPTRMVSEMARRLSAQHRWAVTGTPITRDVSDLYGLIDYLDMSPYSEIDTWNNLLYIPYCIGNEQPLHTFLAEIMWRTAKTDVLSQIDIPPQTVRQYVLEFSPVEKYYYNREHEMCAHDFLSGICKFADQEATLSTLDKSKLKFILAPLLSIRQACTHPHTSRGRYLASRKQVANMKDLLEALITKNKLESEESLRVVLSSHNGIAGIRMLQGKHDLAADEYVKAYELANKYTKSTDDLHSINVDKLQHVHIMHNLAEVIEIGQIDIAVDSASLRKNCLDLEEQYMDRFIQQASLTYCETTACTGAVEKIQTGWILQPGTWFSHLMDRIVEKNMEDELMRRITNQSENISSDKLNSFSSVKKILYEVVVWSDKIHDMQSVLVKLLREIATEDENGKLAIRLDVVNNATECHLRPQEDKSKRPKKLCVLCVTNDHFKKYESLLFNTTTRATSNENISNLGNWKASAEEIVLKLVYALGKSLGDNRDVLVDGAKHLSLCFAFRKQFKELRKLWTVFCRLVSAKDELDMCKQRLQLKPTTSEDLDENEHHQRNRALRNLDNRIINPLENIHMLREHELDYHLNKLHEERLDRTKMLQHSLGTQSYLETLRKQQYTGQKPDPCPICQNSLEEQWCILQCGHCYCFLCIDTIIEQSVAFIVCSVCRRRHRINSITYIKENVVLPAADQIVGNHSTKIEAIVKLVRALKIDDREVKVIVFSTWLPVLKVLSAALVLNDISNEILVSTGSLQKKLDKFKDATSGVTALLLPVALGSKGLNIIEATHVIFVEPLLNPGDELQAIGRVHRIGQTKPTVVHKFIVKNTIEASIFQAVSTNADVWDKNKVTLTQLRDLFTE